MVAYSCRRTPVLRRGGPSASGGGQNGHPAVASSTLVMILFQLSESHTPGQMPFSLRLLHFGSLLTPSRISIAARVSAYPSNPDGGM